MISDAESDASKIDIFIGEPFYEALVHGHSLELAIAEKCRCLTCQAAQFAAAVDDDLLVCGDLAQAVGQLIQRQ